MVDAVDEKQISNARSWFEAMRCTGMREACLFEKMDRMRFKISAAVGLLGWRRLASGAKVFAYW